MKFLKILEKLRHISPALVSRSLQLTNNIVTKDEHFLAVWWQLARDGRMLLSIREAYNLYFYLSQCLNLGGAIAELGVYKGGGAKLMSAFKSDRPLHLFDTFAGMPEVNNCFDLHKEGDFSDTTMENVEAYLEKDKTCHFHKGFFPDTTDDLPDNIEFCFVHLDADLYKSTLAGLEYFYPRLQKGGVIISHDYNAISCPGIRKAFDEYFGGTT